MAKKKAPRAGDVCEDCPNPDIVAQRKVHFGKKTWEFECEYAVEIHVTGEGITIDCAKDSKSCCIDDSQKIFVNSPKISPMRSFFEITMGYLGITKKE